MTTEPKKPILRIDDVKCDFQLSMNESGKVHLCIDNVPSEIMQEIQKWNSEAINPLMRTDGETILFYSLEPQDGIDIFSE